MSPDPSPPHDVAELVELTRFTTELPFALDGFQHRACAALERGHGVLVCAPTGAGKTVVGEFAVHLALASGGKCFYTTPLKALSNQKHTDSPPATAATASACSPETCPSTPMRPWWS